VSAVGEALRAQARVLLELAAVVDQAPARDADGLVAVSELPERKAVERLVREKKLAATRLGRRLFVRRSDLVALVDKQPGEMRRKWTLADAVKRK
jgi:hypothetical protein